MILYCRISADSLRASIDGDDYNVIIFKATKDMTLIPVVDIEGMCGENYRSKKVRKFACKSLRNLGNRSGIRVIFVIEEEDLKITFIEIYHKSDKELENKER